MPEKNQVKKLSMWNRDLYHQRQQGKLQFLIKDLQSFLRFLRSYGKIRLYVIFDFFEKLKDALVSDFTPKTW